MEKLSISSIVLFTMTSSSKFFREDSKLLMESERSQQNKIFFKFTLCLSLFVWEL